ncbi:MAG: hypothetical protein R3252_11105 [Robiginitalea sp.]|nr:hypothetical protein [Robiginitalea sp.]
MRKAFLFLLLLAGTYSFAQEQPLSPPSEKEGAKTGVWNTPANTEDDILHVMAAENTDFLMERYEIEGPQKRKQIYQAYRNYLLAEHRNNLQGKTSRGPSKGEDVSAPLRQLKTKLKAITGMEVDPSLPR